MFESLELLNVTFALNHEITKLNEYILCVLLLNCYNEFREGLVLLKPLTSVTVVERKVLRLYIQPFTQYSVWLCHIGEGAIQMKEMPL